MHDVVIRGGTVVDGTGAPAFTADVVIDGSRIVDVTTSAGTAARRTIDADGAIVTPGFVDIHTHYDGQLTWDPILAPSADHGVTTVIGGNCGVGFAPARPDDHEWLIGLMEGVEDIPGVALAQGLDWRWETFGDYLDAVEPMPRAMDVGVQVAHGPVRAYVMGRRGAYNEAATRADIAGMAALVKDAISAGALGFSTSRTIIHKAIDGEPVPGTYAAEDELFGIGEVLRELGTGVFELAVAGSAGEDQLAPDREMSWMRRLSAHIGRPITFGSAQAHSDPDAWRRQYEHCLHAQSEGAELYPQTLGRAQCVLLGHQTLHPFLYKPTYRRLKDVPLDERVPQLRRPEVKAAILSEQPLPPDEGDGLAILFDYPMDRIYALGSPPNYEPGPEDSIAFRAQQLGRDPLDVLYDAMLTAGGQELFLYVLMNYADNNLDAVGDMLRHPRSVAGLSDGGAHYAHICDASIPTFLLSYWARDRGRGRLPLELVVHKQTAATAELFGLHDRGKLVAGAKADVNVIDFDNLALHPPRMVHDLPTGAGRLLQGADGYVVTLLSGDAIRAAGDDTGARPGRLIRGPQAAGLS